MSALSASPAPFPSEGSPTPTLTQVLLRIDDAHPMGLGELTSARARLDACVERALLGPAAGAQAPSVPLKLKKKKAARHHLADGRARMAENVSPRLSHQPFRGGTQPT